jgi:hypothetical protein|nr:MAG TPA: NADH-PPase NADH pyrophosphatase zinc ribbon domain [Caudoviricetes sp.]
MKTRKFCPKCGQALAQSFTEGYAFQCFTCDEDFYEIEVVCKEEKLTLDNVKEEYQKSDVCMGETLAFIPADSLSLEEAFQLYIEAMKWAEKDRFYVSKEDSLPQEL